MKGNELKIENTTKDKCNHYIIKL